MLKLSTYLNFKGQAEEAFNFYQSVLGGELFVQHMNETPFGENLPANEKNCAMHVSLTLANGVTLMASDILESAGHQLKVGNNYYVSIHTDSRAEADRIFNSLSADGVIEMPMEDMFWGDYLGVFADRYGIQWMISHHTEK